MGSVNKSKICMKRLYIFIIFIICLLQACATGQLAQQQKIDTYPLDTRFNNRAFEYISDRDEMLGYIDWENRVIHSVGDGAMPPYAVNLAQARLKAKRAAIDEAYARMLEIANNVRIDSKSTTRNYFNENRAVQTKISGMIKYAEIERIKQNKDGSYQVMMKMRMDGGEGLSSALLPVQIKKVRVISSSAQSTPPPEPVSFSGVKKAENYTGLIIDARGLGLKPAMFPRVLMETGESVYNINSANPNAAVENGLVAYRKNLDAAKQVARIGNNPLIVKAQKVRGEYGVDIVVSDSDAQKIYQADNKGGILGEAKVVVVID